MRAGEMPVCRHVSPRPGCSPVPSLVRLCELVHRSVYSRQCVSLSLRPGFSICNAQDRQPKNSPKAGPQGLFPPPAADDQGPAMEAWKYSYQKPPLPLTCPIKMNTSSSHRVSHFTRINSQLPMGHICPRSIQGQSFVSRGQTSLPPPLPTSPSPSPPYLLYP